MYTQKEMQVKISHFAHIANDKRNTYHKRNEAKDNIIQLQDLQIQSILEKNESMKVDSNVISMLSEIESMKSFVNLNNKKIKHLN